MSDSRAAPGKLVSLLSRDRLPKSRLELNKCLPSHTISLFLFPIILYFLPFHLAAKCSTVCSLSLSNFIMKNADIELHHIPTMPSSLHRSQSFTRSTTSRSSPFPLPPPRRIHSAPLKRSPSRTSSRSSSSASTSSSEHAEKAQYHIPKHRHTNVYTECGRHSDDWLFGGLGLGDVVGWIRGRVPNVQHGK